jgi:ATP phosphoribosyltransferase regulatory subunit
MVGYMADPLSRIPGGMRYYSGAEARVRRSVEDTVMRVFSGWSYEEITTPLVDYFALFERGMGASEASHSFRFSDSDGRMLALRPDVTSLVARAASTLFAKRKRPLRFSYAAPVLFQRPRSHADWRRESMQLGCELIGSCGGASDIEVIAIALEILERLGFGADVRLTINNVEIFNGIAENLGMDAVAREQMRSLVDLRDASELDRFLSAYDASAWECNVFANLTQLSGKQEILDTARDVINNPRSVAALDSLEKLWSIVEELGFADRCDIDLGDVSGLDYYTGMIFKIYVSGAGARVGSGGRYDNLIANFGNPEPAVGFVLDLDAITEVISRRATTDAREAGDAVIVANLSDDDPVLLFREAIARRAAGEVVQLGGGSEQV